MRLCTPGIGLNLWGESPLYVNPVNVLNTLTKILAEGKGGIVRFCPKSWSKAESEPQARATEKERQPGV